MPSCAWCAQTLVRENVDCGQIWRAADGSAWCEVRGEWKRHGVGDPKVSDALPPGKPDRVPGERKVAYSHLPYDHDKCPRPDKLPLTKTEAVEEEKRLRGRGHRDIRTYLCPGCGAWHIGKNRAALTKRIRHTLNRDRNSDHAYRRKHR